MAITFSNESSSSRGFLARFSIGILSLILRTVILFVILEMILRLFGVQPQIDMVNPEGPFQTDDILKWKFKPNYNGTWSEVEFHTNGLGFRDNDFPIQKPENEFRILILGGSITTGYQMELNQVYVTQLEELLGRTMSYPVQVINAGIPGYSTFQYIPLLRDLGLELQPNHIILDFSMNDVTDKKHNLMEHGGEGAFRGGGAFLRFQEKMLWTDRIKEKILELPRYTSLFTVAKAMKVRLKAKLHPQKELNEERQKMDLLLSPDPTAEIQRAWEETYEELTRLIEMAEQANIPFTLMMFPIRKQVDMIEGLNVPQSRLSEFAQNKGIPFIDLLPVFRKKVAEGTKVDDLFVDDEHPSATGHNLTAATLHQYFLDQKFLTSSETPSPTPTPSATLDQKEP